MSSLNTKSGSGRNIADNLIATRGRLFAIKHRILAALKHKLSAIARRGAKRIGHIRNQRNFSSFRVKSAVSDLKLHIGCGKNLMPQLVNIDLVRPADVKMDVRYDLPLEGNSVGFIYSEHFMEHFTREQGVDCIHEFYRVLKPGGVLRIATPDLDFLIERYLGNWKDQDWLSWEGYKGISSRVEMINVAFHEWGHRYLYNQEELCRRLREVVFEEIARCPWGESSHPVLCSIETRRDSTLILEAVK